MGRPRKDPGALKVKVPDVISDGKGGFLPVGTMFEAADDEAAASLKAKGWAD
jgi:hypothetical protein